MITYVAPYTQAQRFDDPAVTPPVTLVPTYPTNAVGDLLTAWINVTDQTFSVYPTVTPPAGWTLIVDNGSSGGAGVRRAVYYKQGDGSTGTMTWSFNKPIRGHIDIIVHHAVAVSSPIKASSFHNDRFAAAVDTTGTDNCMIIAGWFSAGTCDHFLSGDFSETIVDITGQTGGAERPALIMDGIQGQAGSSGIKTAIPYCFENVNLAIETQALMIALVPYGPTDPVLITPTPTGAGPTITIGSSYDITWTPSTSPTAAQSTLKYHIQYSSDNGVSWSDVVALTTAGVTTYAWNTTGRSAGTNYLIRIRANDPAASLYSLGYSVSQRFTLVTETAPTAPTNLSPSSGARNKASVVTMSWLHGGGAGNPQTKFTLQWSRDAFASHTATVGPTTTGTQSTTIDFSGEADGATITWKVKTTGVTLDSPYSNPVAFIAASLPATPNITAPVAASPPTIPLPTLTFTESSAFTKRQYRVLQSGNQVYTTGLVSSTALSFVTEYPLANGVEYVLKLLVENQYGLQSAEDSETVTPSYSAPAQPVLTLTANSVGGYIQIDIANSDSPDYQELWRFETATQTTTDAIRISPQLAPDASFKDYNVRSGIGYSYFARAYASGLFRDSNTAS